VSAQNKREAVDESRRCACVARDAHDCYVLRYSPSLEDTDQGRERSMYEVCECQCHVLDSYRDDE